jgi:hypothetical protein
MSSQLEEVAWSGNGRLMRAAGIETFGGEVQMLELAAPQSLTPDEVVIAVRERSRTPTCGVNPRCRVGGLIQGVFK